MKLFGFELSRALGNKSGTDTKLSTSPSIVSFSPPADIDGTANITASAAPSGGYYAQILNIDGVSYSNERDAINKYRNAATQPECDSAISEIVNAAIISDSDGLPVNLDMDKLDLSEAVKKRFLEEFNTVLGLLDFNFVGSEIFRKWYIDGKLYYHIIIDSNKPKDGIKEVRLIDPANIRKVREISTKINKETGIKTVETTAEYFVYSDSAQGVNYANNQGIRIDLNSIVYVPSGITDETGRNSISHLNKSVKLVNQLRKMEDSLVIYRVARAPERRIFYIDVGNLPKGKSEEYVQGLMAKYRNKLVYDANSGEISDDRKSMSMLEDFWLPRREGGRGTEITTLPGGENLSQIEDVIFFQKKLYKSLNVPVARLESDNMFSMGRTSEISREEVKFQKFVNKLRRKFSTLFIDLLRVQLILKSVTTEEDWSQIRQNISVDYVEDNFFSELKDFEIMKERLSMLDSVAPHIGKYYSEKYVRSNLLNMSDEDIERMQGEIDEELAAAPPEEEEDDEI